MALLPADQLIEPVSDLHAALQAGFTIAAENRCLVTYGIAPRFAATGYGYICLGEDLPEVEALKVNQVATLLKNPMNRQRIRI